MKNIASLVGVFLGVIIFGAILGFSITLLFIHATNLVVGGASGGIQMKQLLSVLLLWAGTATVTTSTFIVIYTIRYPQNGLARIITYTVLFLLAWLLIIPLCVHFFDQLAKVQIFEPKNQLLTAHYFREDNGQLYYYSSVDAATRTANGVAFKLDDIASSVDDSILLENAPLIQSDIQPFSDALVYDTLSTSRLIDTFLPAIYNTRDAAISSVEGGVLTWLTFATWGLALYSLIGLRRLFQWRLLNFCGVLLGFLGVCTLNLSYYWGWDGDLFGLVTLPNWLANCIIAAVLSCLGILLAIFRPDPNMEPEE